MITKRNLNSNIKDEHFFRHFKGKWYMILNTAEHTETGEQMVIYKALYGENKIYCRPMKMFLEPTDKEKYPDANQEYRFMSIKELIRTLGRKKVKQLLTKECVFNKGVVSWPNLSGTPRKKSVK